MAVMEVASGEYGDQMVRLVKAVQKQAEPNGDTKPHPLLWQRTDEVKYWATTAAHEIFSEKSPEIAYNKESKLLIIYIGL